MLRQQSKKSKKNRPRFKGICELAKSLDLDRIHVYRVLIGERKSPRVEAAARAKWPRYFTHRPKSKANAQTTN